MIMNILKRVLPAVVLVLAFAGCEEKEDVVIEENKLPEAAQHYLDTHFHDAAVIQVVKDREGLRNEYEVVLEEHIVLEFNGKGEAESVRSAQQLPDSIIPASISAYVKANYAAEYITGWELDDRGQEVRLSNGMELKFNAAGEFLRIDAILPG